MSSMVTPCKLSTGAAMLGLATVSLLYGHLAFGQQNNIKVKLSWEYQNLSPGMKVYEPQSGKPIEVWRTGSVKEAKQLPVSSEVEASITSVPRGGHKAVVLVYKNDTAKSVYFFAAPHAAIPTESSLGFKAKCLCINQVYEVGPGDFWYRVIDVAVSRNFDGVEIEMRHALVGVNEERKQKFERPMRFSID